MKTIKLFAVQAILALTVMSNFAFAQTPVKKKITFAAGKSSATVSGSIKGYNSIDYLVSAQEGQNLSVTLSTKHSATYFNILPPGSNDEAIYNSSMASNTHTLSLPSTGTYSIRVYMERSAARRNETASFSLTVSVTGSSSAGNGTVPGTKFNATGQIRGHVVPNEYASQSADYGIIRYGNQRVDVHVNFVGGYTRVLKYDAGKWTCDNMKTRAIFNDKNEYEVILNENEVYIIPDRLLYGG